MIKNGTPNRARPAKPASRVLALLTAGAFALASVAPAHAQRGPRAGLATISDAEIEQLLRDYVSPILRVAGLSKQNIQVVIINNPTFNAFVADGRRIFINSGALFQAETPNEIIGVLAHETGHIAGGHLSRLREQVSRAQTQSVIAMLAGIGAMVAGASAGGSNVGGNIGAATLVAPQEMIRRSLLAYQRGQEEQADRAAVKFLTATGQSAKGMYDTFKRLGDELLLKKHDIDPYVQSHPMPSDRVAALAEMARSSPYWNKKDSPALQFRHNLMRAKLSGFIDKPATVYRRYPLSDNSLPARYARAISDYQYADLQRAVAKIDQLIAAQPDNPYFHELKGQALFEKGRVADAIAPLRRAHNLAPRSAQIAIMLGQALVESRDRGHADEAITLLRRAVITEPNLPIAYRRLADAYYLKGDRARADLYSAQEAYARGDMKTARQLAARAKIGLKAHSPAWYQADDLINLKPGQHSENQ